MRAPPGTWQNRQADLIEPIHEIPDRLCVAHLPLRIKSQELPPPDAQVVIPCRDAKDAGCGATRIMAGSGHPPCTIAPPGVLGI